MNSNAKEILSKNLHVEQNFVHRLTNQSTEWNWYMLKERFEHIINIIKLDEIKTIFDIGSRDAIESINMATIFEDAHIHAFEPSPYNFSMCIENISIQRQDIVDRIFLHKIAANDKTEVIDFWELDIDAAMVKPVLNHGIASKFRLKNPDEFYDQHCAQRCVKVPGFRLDDYCKIDRVNIDRVDGIWMDCQGSEFDVLRGFEEGLKDVQFIITEAGGSDPYYNQQTLKSDIDSFLGSRGFMLLSNASINLDGRESEVIYLNKNLFY